MKCCADSAVFAAPSFAEAAAMSGPFVPVSLLFVSVVPAAFPVHHAG